MRKSAVIIWISFLFALIAWQFWHNEWKYSLPTPVPQSYHPAQAGARIDLAGKLESYKKPIFLHFFNPSCPCSRFNIPHVKSLVKKYGNQMTFAIVVMSKDKNYSAEEVLDKFGLTIPVLSDATIAQSCGVYSTPQAVIIDTDGKLYYRGNYNKSRYCTDKNSNYAQMAIDSLLRKTSHPVFSELALKAYGCQLPVCAK
jgi:peroxiredoxin